MRILGKWSLCEDGVVRPVLVLDVSSEAGPLLEETFLVDSGADRTVFSQAFLDKLGGTTMPAPPGIQVAGIGGKQPFVQVQVTVSLRRSDGGLATVQGSFAAFTDPCATDMSILGRDILDHFDVIISKRRNEVALIAPPSRYEIQP